MKKKYRIIGGWIMLLALCLLLSMTAASAADVEFKLVPASSMMVYDDSGALEYTTEHTDGRFHPVIDVDASDWQSYMLGNGMSEEGMPYGVVGVSLKLPKDAAGYVVFSDMLFEYDIDDNAALLEELKSSRQYMFNQYGTSGEMVEHVYVPAVYYWNNSLTSYQSEPQVFCVGLLNDAEEIYEVQKMEIEFGFTREQWTAPSVRKMSSDEVEVIVYNEMYEPDENVLIYRDGNNDYVVEVDASKMADPYNASVSIRYMVPQGAAAFMQYGRKREFGDFEPSSVDKECWLDYLGDGKFYADTVYDSILWLDADGNPMLQSGSVLIHIKNAGSGTGDEPGDGSNVEFKQVPAENIAFDGYEGLLQYKAQYTDGNYKVTIDADKTDWQKYMLGQEVVRTSWHGDVPISVNFSTEAAGYVYFLEKASEFEDDAAILERLEMINLLEGYYGGDYYTFTQWDTRGCIQLPPDMPILNYDMEAGVLYQPSYTKKPQLFCIGLLNEDGKIYEVQKMTVEVGFTQDDWVVEPMRKMSSSGANLFVSDENMHVYADSNDDYVVEVYPLKMEDPSYAYITVDFIVPEDAAAFMKDGVKDTLYYPTMSYTWSYGIDPYNNGNIENFDFITSILWLDDDGNMLPQSGALTIKVKNMEAKEPPRPVDLPAELAEIEPYAFEKSAFGFVRCPDDMSRIGAYAFKDCTNLEIIYIGADTVIDETAFDGCTSLWLIQSSRTGCPAQEMAEKLGVVFQLKEQ